MTKILAIETSSAACSVAINDGEVDYSFHELMPRQHTEELIGVIDNLLKSASLDIKDLDLSDGVMSGTFSATLYRGTPVNDPGAFMGVDNFTDLDLYNPLLNDMVDNYDLTDSIRIENCVFQRITVINNIP